MTLLAGAAATFGDELTDRAIRFVPSLKLSLDTSLEAGGACGNRKLGSMVPPLVRGIDYSEGVFTTARVKLKQGVERLEVKILDLPEHFKALLAREHNVLLVPIPDGPAEADSKNHRDPKRWKVLAFGAGLAIPTFFLNTTVHEGSHALAITAIGADVIGFQPYPHLEEIDGKKHLYFGEMEYQWTGDRPKGEWISDLAPQIADVAGISTYYALMESGHLPKNKYLKMALLMMPLAGLVDMGNHARNGVLFPDPSSDFSKFKQRVGASQGGMRIVADATELTLVAAGAYVVVQGFRDLLSNKPDMPEPKKGIQFDLTGTGAMISGTF